MRDTHNRLHIEKPRLLTPLEKVFDDRIIDWIEDGMNLNHQMQKHREKYRKKICTKCSDTQKEIRGCVIVDEVLDKRDCSHMDSALNQKFREKNKIHTEANPQALRMKAMYANKQ